MQNSIQMELLAATAESGFSLDELVFNLKELMHEKGMAGIVELILQILDENLCMSICQHRSAWTPKHCCSAPRHEHLDCRTRSIRTSVGKLQFQWRRLRCVQCGRTLLPLRSFLGLEPNQAKTSELEKIVVEVVSEQSYRRSSKHLKTIGEIPVPKSTAHRWVAQSECDETDSGTETFGLLLGDGTGYKRRPEKVKAINNRGEVRIAFGVENTGQITALGAWSGESWEAIAKQIHGKRDKNTPVAEMLVSDGERGLIESLGKLCGDQQRCHWHGVRDLNYTMWQDNAPLDERKRNQRELAGIIGIELPEENFEKVGPADKAALAQAVIEAEKKVDTLWKRLLAKGYGEASGYVAKMSSQLFSYVRRWLETGLVSPRAASWIERVMREIARRLKRMAFGWSEQGAAKMARIILKRFTSAAAWEKYWKKKLRIEGNVILVLKSIKAISPPNMGR